MRAPILTFKRARKLRRAMTLPEVVLWQALRGNRFHGLRFRRQHPIGPYVLDFFSAAARLAVEIDGLSHEQPDRIRHDIRRDAWLARQRVRVLRVAARDVLDDDCLEATLATIARAAAPSTAPARFARKKQEARKARRIGPPPPLRGGGTRGPVP